MELKVEPKYLRSYKNGKYHGELEAKIKAEWGFKYIQKGCGYFADTNQIVLAIIVGKGKGNPEIIKKELVAMMPYIKPTPTSSIDTPNIRRINIVEHTHAEEANYNVGYDSDKEQWYIIRHRYGVAELEAMGLDDVIKRLMEVHYWESE